MMKIMMMTTIMVITIITVITESHLGAASLELVQVYILRIIFFIYFQLQDPNEAIKQCNEALKLDENDVDALCDRGEAHILNEMYDEGQFQ